MKATKITLLISCVLAIGIAGGYFIGVQSERKYLQKEQNEMAETISLGDSALRVTEFITLLNGLRSGYEKQTIDRLEILLDFSIIEIGRKFSPARDWNGDAIKSLQLAKEYRQTFPHQSSEDSVTKEVNAALAIAPKTLQ